MNNVSKFALGLGLSVAAVGVNAATLVSAALGSADIDGNVFNSGSTTGATTGTVTTARVSGQGSGSGTRTYTFSAVDLANGMDLTYDVTVASFILDVSDGNAVVGQTTRVNGGRVTVGPSDQDGTTTRSNGDIEFISFTVGNVVNSGTTTWFLEGFTAFAAVNPNGADFQDVNNGGAVLATLPIGGSNGDFALSSTSTAVDLVATNATPSNRNRENKIEGFAVQFTDVPEPGSLALIAMGGMLMSRRRR